MIGLPRLLLGAHRSIDGEIRAALLDRGAADLRVGHARAMLLIDRTGTRLSELASRAGITKQAMMQVVDELAQQGFVRRVPDASDARAKIVKLTARGLRHRAESRRALATVETRLRRRLGERRYEGLRTALEDLATAEE